LPYSSALKREAVCAFNTSENLSQTLWHHTPEATVQTTSNHEYVVQRGEGKQEWYAVRTGDGKQQWYLVHKGDRKQEQYVVQTADRKQKQYMVQKGDRKQEQCGSNRGQGTKALCGSNRGQGTRAVCTSKERQFELFISNRILCHLNSWPYQSNEFPYFLLSNPLTHFF
jgi:hypothetical protein